MSTNSNKPEIGPLREGTPSAIEVSAKNMRRVLADAALRMNKQIENGDKSDGSVRRLPDSEWIGER